MSGGYHIEKFVKRLPMDLFGSGSYDHPEMFDNDVATHVVVKILYGADAVFVFETSTGSEKNIENVEENLEASVNKIPNCSGEASVKGTRDTDLGEVVTEVSCTFHGDFDIRDPPTTFSEAISTYQRLPGKYDT